MIESARSFLSGWGWTYLSQLGRRRLRFPAPLAGGGTVHFILVVANHFEPFSNGWTRPESVHAIRRWCTDLERLGVKDASGHPFKHTYFFPAEQYHREFLEPLAAHCTAGFGEVEVQIHHGISPTRPRSWRGPSAASWIGWQATTVWRGIGRPGVSGTASSTGTGPSRIALAAPTAAWTTRWRSWLGPGAFWTVRSPPRLVAPRLV